MINHKFKTKLSSLLFFVLPALPLSAQSITIAESTWKVDDTSLIFLSFETSNPVADLSIQFHRYLNGVDMVLCDYTITDFAGGELMLALDKDGNYKDCDQKFSSSALQSSTVKLSGLITDQPAVFKSIWAVQQVKVEPTQSVVWSGSYFYIVDTEISELHDSVDEIIATSQKYPDAVFYALTVQ